ncbi:hypothetical protein Tco_0318467 [Tanacetum coccineum]
MVENVDHRVQAEVGGSPTDGSELIPRNNEKIVPDQAKDAAAQYRQRAMPIINESNGSSRLVDRVSLRSRLGKLELPQELSRVHHTFHVSNLKKHYADEPLAMPLEGIHVDDKLQFMRPR